MGYNENLALCLLCESPSFNKIATNSSFGINIIECSGCGFVQSEYVSEAALRDYYSNFYRGPLSQEQIISQRSKSHRQAVSQIEYINSIIPGKIFKNTLDYGTADGELAKLLKGCSQNVYVTEYDPQYKELLKQEKDIVLLNDTDLDSIEFEKFFDLISISHVLEHLSNPLSALERFSVILKKDAFLFVDIPSELELLKKANFQGHGHLFYFNVDSFKKMVDVHGKFDILEIRTCNRSVEEFIASGFQLPEQYFRQNTPNGTTIRSLLINARPDAPFNSGVNDSIDSKLLLQEPSRRILYMHQNTLVLQSQIQELEREYQAAIKTHIKLLKRLDQPTDKHKDTLNQSTSEVLSDRKQTAKFDDFLLKIKADTYSEPPREPHITITNQMFDYVNTTFPLQPNSKILDVGCGQGVALEIFTQNGFSPVGITLSEEDRFACKQKGFEVLKMDQSFLDFSDREFDFVWCRHCLEHSIFPYFTLSELYRVLKKKGYLYIEVPAPDTSCNHQTNANHYSVLGKSMWIELIRRTGFEILDIRDISFEVAAGPDVYWAFIQQKT